MHWKLTLTYDGTSFHGWQVQPGRPTVQGTLSHALHHLTGETVLPQGSGRTDAGVHALAQVATFSLSTNIPPENLLRALNRALPPSIRVLSATHAPETFHARYSALRKSYEYRIFPLLKPRVPHPHDSTIGVRVGLRAGTHEPPPSISPICPPFLAPYVWDCPWPLDPTPMQLAATLLLGTHDFTSFAASDPDLTHRNATKQNPVTLSEEKDLLSSVQSTIPVISTEAKRSGETPVFRNADPASASPNTRTLHTSSLTLENNILLFRVTGSGFLHHMVRNIVGTLVDIGRGALTPNDIPRILSARNRSSAGPTAPPQGLFLVSVEYPEHLTG